MSAKFMRTAQFQSEIHFSLSLSLPVPHTHPYMCHCAQWKSFSFDICCLRGRLSWTRFKFIACHGMLCCHRFWHRHFHLIQTDTFRVYPEPKWSRSTPLTMTIKFHLNIYLFAENGTNTFSLPRQSLQRCNDECGRNTNWPNAELHHRGVSFLAMPSSKN